MSTPDCVGQSDFPTFNLLKNAKKEKNKKKTKKPRKKKQNKKLMDAEDELKKGGAKAGSILTGHVKVC